MRLIKLTSGRRKVFPARMKAVSSAASASRSAPEKAPTAAELHRVAAVFRPRTFTPSFMMTPAPRNSDAGDHVGDHLDCAGVAAEPHAKVDEGRCPYRDQHVGAQSRGALAVLPFRTDQHPEQERRYQAGRRIEEFQRIEGLNCRHANRAQLLYPIEAIALCRADRLHCPAGVRNPCQASRTWK